MIRNHIPNIDLTSWNRISFAKAAVFIVVFSFILIPLYWSVMSSFKSPQGIYARPPTLFPESVSFIHYSNLLSTSFFTYFKNSSIVAIGATGITTALSILGGYGLSRASFRGKKTLARSVLISYMFPPILLGIPLYAVFYNIDMLNSYISLVLAHTAVALPFGTWLMWQYFQTIPASYEESGWINGASKLRTLWDIIIPMARPGAIAVAIFTFAISWNDYTLSVILMTEPAKLTLPVGTNLFIEEMSIPWGLIQASGVLIMLPPFLLVLFLQRYILEGFSVSGFE